MGRRQKRLEPEEIREALRAAESPVLSTTQLAERFDDVSRPTVGKRLAEYEEEGAVGKHETGNAVVWFHPELTERGGAETEETAAATDDDSATDSGADDEESPTGVREIVGVVVMVGVTVILAGVLSGFVLGVDSGAGGSAAGGLETAAAVFIGVCGALATAGGGAYLLERVRRAYAD